MGKFLTQLKKISRPLYVARKVCVLILLVTISLVSKAQFEAGNTATTSTKLTGAAIVNGAVADLSYTVTPVASKKITNVVYLRIQEKDPLFFQTDFNFSVNINVEYWPTLSGPAATPLTKTLTVDYKKNAGTKFKPLDYFTLPEAERVKVTVTAIPALNPSSSVWSPLPAIELENEMRTIRYYSLSTNTTDLTPTTFAAVCPNNIVTNLDDEMQINWSWSANAHNNLTQLEWAWVENEMEPYYFNTGTTTVNTDLLFANNSTRVDLDARTTNSYKVPLLYDGVGKLYYRIRSAYRNNDGSVINGPWATANSCPFIGHEPMLNWQSSTSFAEEGKRKSVIQYFDGSLRQRQTVTKDNSNNNIVVAETIYDFQGRANLQILPTPVHNTISSKIKYFENFNKFEGQGVNQDPAELFDLTPAGASRCAKSPKLDITVGNGMYYSANNQWLGADAKAKYIPDAEGYAYTETRFMDDATQRVSSQGGVGKAHQIGDSTTPGNETKYYYGKPAQQELDALFGTEVGDATHYSKNMVQDANGQFSVSYVDMHGRTVATALAGEAPTNLKSLTPSADYPLTTAQIKNQLLTPQNNIVEGNSIEMINTILVPKSGTYNFTYKLNPEILSLTNCSNQQICYDCKYDLEISIRKEDCSDAPPIIRKFSNLTLVPLNQSCSTSMGFEGTGVNTATKQIDFAELLQPGSYTIRKTLKINDSLFAIQRASALQQLLCTTQQNLYDSVFNVLSTISGCGYTPSQQCDTCLVRLGTRSQFKIKYLNSIGNPVLTTELDQEINQLYIEDSIACVQICTGGSPDNNTLASLRQQMLNDMVPYTGQYAQEPIVSNIPPNSLSEKYNIFTPTTANFGSTNRPFYKNPQHENGQNFYLDDLGNQDISIHATATLPATGTILSNSSPADFTGLFAPTWANSLLRYHPEYNKLVLAETTLKTSYEYLDKLQNCNTYAEAATKGYINPLTTDPFYLNYASPAEIAKMNTRLNATISFSPTGVAQEPAPSIWNIANGTVLCASTPDYQKMSCILNNTNSTGINVNIPPGTDRDKVWESFRTQYLSYRYEDVIKYINNHPSVTATLPVGDNDILQNSTNNKQLHFASMQQFANQNGAGTWWNQITTTVPPNTSGIITWANGQALNYCEGQKPYWKAKLLQCSEIQNLLNSTLSADVTKGNLVINQILDGLVQVCNNSIDPLNPNGASNVNPAVPVSGYQNFEQVVNGVLTANGVASTPNGTSNYYCNPFTIDYPKPYGKNTPVATNYVNKLDSCACKRFNELIAEAGIFGSSLNAFNQYLLANNYGDTVNVVIWNALQQCGNFWVDTCQALRVNNALHTKPKNNGITNNSTARTPGCLIPVVNNVSFVNLGNTVKMKVIYDMKADWDSCTIEVFNQNNNLITNYQIPWGSGNFGSISGTTYISNLDSCNNYKVIVKYFAPPTCPNEESDTAYWYSTCNPCLVYNPILLTEPVVLPPFLNCGYVKPCISCTTFTTYHNEFKAKYASANYKVPYVGASLTQAQYQQNNLWARFLNYRTGFSKSANDYIVMFRNCIDSTGGGTNSCGPGTAPNILNVYTRNTSIANYIARYEINFHPDFESVANDNFMAYIDSTLTPCDSLGTPIPANTNYAMCGYGRPLNDPSGYLDTISPCDAVVTQSLYISQLLYEQRKQTLIAKFDSLYKAKCLAAQSLEDMYVNYTPLEYHYTLYYYDQAGNLVKTIPPAAVKPNYDPTYLNNVKAARENNTYLDNTLNNQNLATNYRYNSLNQVVTQKTPDAGISNFWYDALGRLVISQNAKQATTNDYSYTTYDALGRITQVGQKSNTVAMTQTLSQDITALNTWLTDITNGGLRKQITRTVYDITYYDADGLLCPMLCQQNLRNRVSYTQIIPVEPSDGLGNYVGEHSAATYYSYDIHGNVDELVQDLKQATTQLVNYSDNRFKKMTYDYDLISGKVNKVSYQPGWADQYYHKYEYDAENKLTFVKTSKDGIYWEQEAAYDYYRHGPMARTVLGQNQVQGTDYAYTIQGWLKGVNSNAILGANVTPTAGTIYDMGADGNINSSVAKDAFSFSLNYFETTTLKDYIAIGTQTTAYPIAAPFAPVSNTLTAGADAVNTGRNLFNGNIRAMLVNLPNFSNATTPNEGVKLYAYQYDQLNRITAMNAYNGFSNTTNSFSAVTISDNYKERVTYDPNGNIKSYLRNGNSANLAMDNLSYNYNVDGTGKLLNNKLAYVTDGVIGNTYDKDIKTQSAGNYAYDEIGNLTKDLNEGIGTNGIEWTVYGKISKITKTNGTVVNYTYDASGNRITKLVTPSTGAAKLTVYVRDASGNVMSLYENVTPTGSGVGFTQTEAHLYGSSRLGVDNVNRDVSTLALFNINTYSTTFERGNKFFELSNHLGNVLVTVSDRVVQKDVGVFTLICPLPNPPNPNPPCFYNQDNATPDGLVDYYEADVITANDYYPGGMQMPGRTFSGGSQYRYGFNGKEKDNSTGEGNLDFGARIYDSRLGRFLSVDPDYNIYAFQSSYVFAINNPIRMIDVYGKGPGDPLPPPNLDYTWKWKIDGRATKSQEYEDGLWINSTHSRDASNTIMHVTDDKGVSYWIIRESYGAVAHLSNGMALPVQENNYYYFTKPPSNKKSAYKGGEWKSFKTQNRISAEAGYASADGLGTAVFGIAVAGTAGFSLIGLVETYGAAAVTNYVIEEAAEEIFEQVTGIPLVMNPLDVLKQGYKKVVRNQVKQTLVNKFGKKVTEGFGSYTIKYADGTFYHGAGNLEEAISRAAKKSKNNKGGTDMVTELDWTPSPTRPQQFRDEAARLNTDKGAHKSTANRNERDSPGNRKYKDPAND